MYKIHMTHNIAPMFPEGQAEVSWNVGDQDAPPDFLDILLDDEEDDEPESGEEYLHPHEEEEEYEEIEYEEIEYLDEDEADRSAEAEGAVEEEEAAVSNSEMAPEAEVDLEAEVSLMVTLLVTTLWTNAYAQEYLPPKIGGGQKKPIQEPSLPANYDFSYDVQDNGVSLDFGHNEKRKEDHATGSYHVLLPDGRMQLVEYEAGPDGYKPQVMYMGTATFPPAGGASDKFDGYHYNAASNRQSVRQAAPRGGSRAPAPAPQAAPPPHAAPPNATQ